jgi:hypothetical protein
MKVFNEFYMPLIIEEYAQMTEVFNASSGGAFNLLSETHVGDFLKNSFYDNLGATRRVDRYAANGAQASTAITQSEDVAVKVAGGFGPFLWEPSQLTWLKKPDGEAGQVVAQSYASALLIDQINTSIAALVAGIGNVAGLTNDVSATAGAAGGIAYGTIVSTNGLLGDRSQSVNAYVMNGVCENNLRVLNHQNGESLFNGLGPNGSVNVVAGVLDKPIIVTDAPALTVSTTDYHVLGLKQGACEVMHDPSTVITNIESTNGKERIETTMQTDYDFSLKLKGFAWDETNGGKSPDDTDLATGSNWDLNTDAKLAAGVLTTVNQTAP